MFGFGNKKKGASQELDVLVQYHRASEMLEKGKNFAKLGRSSESAAALAAAERIAGKTAKRFPRSTEAHILLALIYKETRQVDKATTVLDRLLNGASFSLTDEQRITLNSELYKIQRETPAGKDAAGSSKEGFTTIYNCQNCGRLINFATMPCHYCQWHPTELEEFARSTFLSSTRMEVGNLLFVSRAVASGRGSSDIVANLVDSANQFVALPEKDTRLRYMFDLLQKNAKKNFRDADQIRECPSCGERLLLSNTDQCNDCGATIDLPDAVRFLMCLDNLLWLFEQRAEVSDSKSFAEFICIIVAMQHEMLRQQEAPSLERRKYALSLLQSLKIVADKNRGAVIEVDEAKEVKLYLIKENMIDDSEQFSMFWYTEVVLVIAFLKNGILV